MCEPRNRDNGASDLWTLTAYYVKLYTLAWLWILIMNINYYEYLNKSEENMQ